LKLLGLLLSFDCSLRNLPSSSIYSTPRPEGGREKRKQAHTERYEEAVAQGDLDESQHGKIGGA
jgi:hypothetical protein